MPTKADLRRMVLSHLTVIDATEDPDAEQARLADLWINGARGMLLERGLCWWDADAIPDAVTVPLTAYVASLSPSSFGRAGKGYEGAKDTALRELAQLKSSAQRETIRGEYF